MKSIMLKLTAVSAAMAAVAAQGAVTFSGYVGSTLQFTPGAGSVAGSVGTLEFTPATADINDANNWQWADGTFTRLGKINGSDTTVGDGLGSFDIGAISTTYNGSHIPANISSQTASILNTGTITIMDNASQLFVGTVNWSTITVGYGYGGSITGGGIFNVTPITYGGTDPFLTQFMAPAGQNKANLNITFQFSPGEWLTDLVNPANGTQFTSYNGALSPTAVPETSTAVAGFAALGLVVLLVSRRKVQA